MIQFQKTTLWLAVFSALFGVVCIAAFMLHQKIDGELLSNATMAATVSTFSLLLGVFFVCARSARQVRPFFRPAAVSIQPDLMAGSSLDEQFQHRREVIGERLNIDEPHFCTQAGAPCTAWSFCGSAPEAQAPASSAEQSAVSPQDVAAASQPLPLIHRHCLPSSCLAQHAEADAKGAGQPLERRDPPRT